jgi:hypothetical protein
MKVSLSEVADMVRGDNRGGSSFTERLLLKIIEDKETKKDDDKGSKRKPLIGSPGDAGKLVVLALVSMPILGPMFWLYCALMMHFAKVVLAQ